MCSEQTPAVHLAGPSTVCVMRCHPSGGISRALAHLLHGKVQHGANDRGAQRQAHDVAPGDAARPVLDALERGPLLAPVVPQRRLCCSVLGW